MADPDIQVLHARYRYFRSSIRGRRAIVQAGKQIDESRFGPDDREKIDQFRQAVNTLGKAAHRYLEELMVESEVFKHPASLGNKTLEEEFTRLSEMSMKMEVEAFEAFLNTLSEGCKATICSAIELSGPVTRLNNEPVFANSREKFLTHVDKLRRGKSIEAAHPTPEPSNNRISMVIKASKK